MNGYKFKILIDWIYKIGISLINITDQTQIEKLITILIQKYKFSESTVDDFILTIDPIDIDLIKNSEIMGFMNIINTLYIEEPTKREIHLILLNKYRNEKYNFDILKQHFRNYTIEEFIEYSHIR